MASNRAKSATTFVKEDIERLVQEEKNWGRWGPDDEMGTLNLITDEKRRSASDLVHHGRVVGLGRVLPTKPGPANPMPAQHYMNRSAHSAVDYYGTSYHGIASTHIDALCHVWNQDGMWNGRNADEEITFKGSNWGAIDKWSDGIVTRGVLLDVPRHRGEEFVAEGRPVHGWELEEICEAQGVEVLPGDAVIVHSGRDAWDRGNGRAWGGGPSTASGDSISELRPGVHGSCLEFMRRTDLGVFAWDMMDVHPSDFDEAFFFHGAIIYSLGVALIDSVYSEGLADVCAELGQYEFMFVTAPLHVTGGTGSPVNPIAVL